MEPQDRPMTTQIGPVQIDWFQSIGYYGGIGLAIAAGMIEPPLGIFIAAVPFLKMLNSPNAPLPVRMVSHLAQGAAKPVGGDSDGVVQVKGSGRGSGKPGLLGGITGRVGDEAGSIWREARQLSRG